MLLSTISAIVINNGDFCTDKYFRVFIFGFPIIFFLLICSQTLTGIALVGLIFPL